jgi:hypothetical protein
MRTIVSGFTGWRQMDKTKQKAVRSLDAAITVDATLLVAVTLTMIHF